MKFNRLLIAVIAGAMLAGCDRLRQKSATGPTTQPVQSASADSTPQSAPAIDSGDANTASATTSPIPASVSFMVHEGTKDRIYDFPRARLRLTKESENKYAAVLYSDDPKTAINSDYHGNSFFLQMKLDLEDPHNLTNVNWPFKAASSDKDETADGIFLDGNRVHLQPSDIMISFDGAGNNVQVLVMGQFLKFEGAGADGNRPPAQVGVRGEFSATVEVK
ncbi:MAG TPA: hypothetical protein VGV35_09170 [Bryobacteraceae bacterium]|nr:hypothetical protein [Bryobacteraceae bacterium]